MKDKNSAILFSRHPLPSPATGIRWGLLGVLAFSLTVPMTRVAVADDGMSALFVGAGRAVIAGVLAALTLWVTGQPRPRGRQWFRVGIVAAGAVLGFPLLTSYALESVPASHGAVVIALLPAVTAVVAVLRSHERPRPSFWAATLAGAITAGILSSLRTGGFGTFHYADLMLFGAVFLCATAYAEGGLLARELGSWQCISWALVLSLPITLLLTGYAVAAHPPAPSPAQWSAFGYLGAVSMFLGFFAWYRGLGIGPMATVSQVQLIQPLLSLLWAGLLLHEVLGWSTLVGGLAVVLCALLATKSRTVAQPLPAESRQEKATEGPSRPK
ncbi:DMT family transporter [Glutamicibacter endophyticus]|uniref:DMT family transporter n=1 Tax=Glutamicibacter endophyticus TaxID=1522174 RepID=UPI003AEFA2F0